MRPPLLILDIDETLVRATDRDEPAPTRVDFMSCGKYPVMKRPHVDDFLRWCFSTHIFKVAVWTKAGSQHAHDVLSNLLQPNEIPEFVWTDTQCTRWWKSPNDEEYGDGDRIFLIKDLRKVKRRGYDLDRVLALDDDYRVYRRSYSNLVHIKPFLGDLGDQELLKVRPFLIKWFEDPRGVRQIEKRGWSKVPPPCTQHSDP